MKPASGEGRLALLLPPCYDRTSANSITGTTATGNALDCQDLSHGSGTSGTANTWSSNNGNTSSPPGLCNPPVTKPTPSTSTTSTTSPP